MAFNGETEAQVLRSRDTDKEFQPSPQTLSKLVKRLRLLTLELLPQEVDPDSLQDATSRIITKDAIAAYTAAAGDFVEALPYCLLRARREFMWDANHSPADYGENFGRAMACEVLARRVIHNAPRERLTYMMSNRFQAIDWDGEDSELMSALEIAVDTHCTVFLSSNESQDVVNALWRGDLITRRKGHDGQDYISYRENFSGSNFWGYLDPSRISVPRYQNLFRILVWLIFLFVYSQAVREPLDQVNPKHQKLDPFEIGLYFLALSFAFEDIHKLYKLLQLIDPRYFSFWLVISIITDSLLVSAFSFRIYGLWAHPGDDTLQRTTAFQVLSYVSPLIWMKLLTIFDGYKYFGTMQICVSRMMRESGIFFALLSILGIGFAQGLYALDAADESASSPSKVVHLLVQALLQAPDYTQFEHSLAGLVLFYLWNVATAVILLNVLVSLFSSAYDDVVEDAEAEYLTFFAGKTIEMIRAPDSYVYPAPTNIIEVFIAPFEFVLNPQTYATLNRYILLVVFFVPLCVIALYESVFLTQGNNWAKSWFRYSASFDEDDSPTARDPTIDEPGGLQISRVSFDEIKRHFPNTQLGEEAVIMNELRAVRAQLNDLLRRLDDVQGPRIGTAAIESSASGSGEGGSKRGQERIGSDGSGASE